LKLHANTLFPYVWNEMKRFVLLMLCSACLASCQTAGGSRSHKDLNDYPEGRAYTECLRSRARAYASQQGSPLELGIIISSSCSGERRALLDAVDRDESPVYTRVLTREMERQSPAVAAEMVIAVRSGR
jgi:hypothetical protein